MSSNSLMHKDIKSKNNLSDLDSFRFYVPGVGARFPANQEWSETQDGKAMGKVGQARILHRNMHTRPARQANQYVGNVSGALSRRARLADSNSGKIDCTVAQKRGL